VLQDSRSQGLTPLNPFTAVLIHSPVVGPFTWAGVASALRRQGIAVVVPSLLVALRRPPPFWQQIAEAAAQSVRAARPTHSVALIAHSGAGPLLPVIGSTLGVPVGAYVFVDAGMPRSGTTAFERAPGLGELLRPLARDGWVPPWSDWWGDAAMRAHLPDDELRARFLSELQPLPLALFEERLPATPWPDAPCAYLQLSAAYDAEAAEVRRQGWPYVRLNSHHLGMLTAPVAISDALVRLVGALLPASGRPAF
jgi:hypothetical protein